MTRFLVTASVTLGLLGAVGCNKSPEGGASGAGSGGNTFKLSGPSTSTTLKQGETKDLNITIGHGKEFKDDVTFEAKGDVMPKGVTVKMSKDKVPATEDRVVLMITAAADSAVGDGLVKVTGKPGSGAATTVDVSFKVEHK